MKPIEARKAAPWLWVLWGLFGLRVVAQPLARVVDLPFLPDFERWHSSVMPYWLLVLCQLVILWVLGRTAWAFSTAKVTRRKRLGVGLVIFGSAYLGSMVARLTLGA